MKIRKPLFCALTMCSLFLGSAQAQSSDNGDGTFTNPMLWSDVPDPDVIRVDDNFYLVSTTMHLMPGAPVMRSKDLVNWETASYLFDRLTDTPNYDMEGCTAYGRGQWATSLRYHNGKYYAYFSPNDKPFRGYVYTTTDPAKEKWELVSRLPHFHDASLLFDDDGRVYVFYGTGQLRELKPDLSDVQPGGVDMKIFERDSTETGLLEGSRAIKYNGKYYLLMISWPNGGKRRQVCYRADKITGPYEKKVILEADFGGFPYVGQGCIVDDAKGNWYGVIFQDRGGVGRVLTLMPCRWVDGWPMLGDENGQVPTVMEKPVQGSPAIPLVVSDDFGNKQMKINWQWNHNPVHKAWSLEERPGYLRLKTSRVVENLFWAPNTLTQRMEGPKCTASVAIDLSHMKEGDVAGFSAFNGNSGVLAVLKENGKKCLTMSEQVVSLDDKSKAVTALDTKEKARVELSQDIIYLRIDGDFRPGKDIATFYYSLNGKDWTKIGSDFKMIFDYRRFFMGTKYAIFNYATQETGGYVDVDYFDYKRIKNEELNLP
jgi:beta-xylosidase